MGAERLDLLLQESIAVPLKTEAIAPKDLSRIVVDTTVEEKRSRSRPMPSSSTGRARSSSLFLAGRVHRQRPGQRGRKVYSIHAPEVECIGKGKAHKPYEFGVKVSVATPVSAPRGGQFVLAAKALPGSPYDGHTLATVIPHVEEIIGNAIQRIVADKGYRGHGAPAPYDMRVYVSEARRDQADRARTQAARRRRAGHRPHEGRAPHGPQLLRYATGDANNAVLAAVGCNLARLVAWLRELLCALLRLWTLLPAQRADRGGLCPRPA